jgi:flagellin
MSSIEILSSGSRINSAADDAAGLAIRELLRADIATAAQATRNINDGASMLQTAEGAASVISGNLVRMKQLAAQASTGTYSDAQRNIMGQEFDQLAAENARIVADTTFNGVSLFDEGQTVEIATGDGTSISLDLQALSLGAAALSTDPEAALQAVDAAIRQAGGVRGKLGGTIARLQRQAEVIAIRAENELKAESRISDANMAMEVASMMSNKVQTQVATAAQVHAGAVAQVVNLLLG